LDQKKNYKDFEVQKAILLEYLQVMIANEDWHGVADMAMDMRELEAKHNAQFKSK
jgi:hypothetical protein